MSEQETDGGAAFPRAMFENDRILDHGADGMTLRDWFAGQALAGLLAGREAYLYPEAWADKAYELAAAMLAERARRAEARDE